MRKYCDILSNVAGDEVLVGVNKYNLFNIEKKIMINTLL